MDSIDRISAMPVDILHHILSFLPKKAAGKASLLSKRWLSVWDSYPVFDFSQDNPEVSSGYGLWTRYSDMVDSRIQKFCKLNFSIQKVKFNIVYVNFAFAYHFKYWMGLITEKNVKELDICIPSGKRNCYIIPQTVFSANSLTVLKICSRCRLYMLEIDDYSRSSMNLPALRTLSLDFVKPNVHYTLTLNVDLGGECQETPWFIKFKEFLQLRTTIRTLQININFNEITEFNKEEALNYCPSPPYSLDHLIMEVVSSSCKMSQLDRAALFDGFLWCCHPIVLSFPLNHFSVQLLEFLCQTFEEDHVCCGSSEMKCWRHSLKMVKDVTVEDKNGIKEKVLFCWEHLSKVISGKRRVSLDLTW